ncbi:MAG TPA: hypothetical protein VI159_09390 [Gemmatimonadales bacterium]
MAARIAVFQVATPIVPATAGTTAIHDGLDRKWLDSDDTWHEFRHPTTRAPIVVQKLASVTISATTYVLCIVWLRGTDRVTPDGSLYPGVLSALRTAGILVADWVCDLAADGTTIQSTALQNDSGTAATRVKAAWPSGWPTTPPTIGAVLA